MYTFDKVCHRSRNVSYVLQTPVNFDSVDDKTCSSIVTVKPTVKVEPCDHQSNHFKHSGPPNTVHVLGIHPLSTILTKSL